MFATGLLILAAFVSADDTAPTTWYVNDRPAEADLSQTGDGIFFAKMLVTSDVDGFWREWQKPDPPHIRTTAEVTRAELVHAMIVFGGCTAGSDGNCDVGVEFSMIGPDGKPYGGGPVAGDAWQGAPPPGRNLQASASSLGFKLDPPDPLGRYIIRAKVIDRVAKKALLVEQAVAATAGDVPAKP
jgi:hypothetical protein